MVRYTGYMNNKNPINVYWSPYYVPENADWSFIYPKPKTLLSDLLKNKNKELKENSFFSCPAVSPKFKKTLVFKNSISCSYEYDATQTPMLIQPKTENYIEANSVRDQAVSFGPTVVFSLHNIFFADEPLEVSLTAPFFHEPKYMKYGSIVPGAFDIGQWFRPINFEVQFWNNKGEFILEDEEPLFYLEFITKRPVILHRFNLTQKAYSYSQANINYSFSFGKMVPLLNRYSRFKEVGFREKILTEIKQNLINEESYKF